MKLLNVCLIVIAVAAFAFPGCVASKRGSRFARCETKSQCQCFKCQSRTAPRQAGCQCGNAGCVVDHVGGSTAVGQTQGLRNEAVIGEAIVVTSTTQPAVSDSFAENAQVIESAPRIESNSIANGDPEIIEAAPLQEAADELAPIQTMMPKADVASVSNRRKLSANVDETKIGDESVVVSGETADEVAVPEPITGSTVVDRVVGSDSEPFTDQDAEAVTEAIPEPFSSNSDWNLPSDEQLDSSPNGDGARLERDSDSSPTSAPAAATPLEAIPVGFPLKRGQENDRVASGEAETLAASQLKPAPRVHGDYEVVDRRLVLKARPVGQNRVQRAASKEVSRRGSIPAISAKLKRIVPGGDLRDLRRSKVNELVQVANSKVSVDQKVAVEETVALINQDSVEVEPEAVISQSTTAQVAAAPAIETQKRRVLLRAVPFSMNSNVQARIVPAGAGSVKGNFRFTDGVGKPTSQVRNAQTLHARPLQAQISQPEVPKSVRPVAIEESWHERTARIAPEEETMMAPWRQR